MKPLHEDDVRALFADLHFHDLRREYGSRLLEGGVGLLTVSALLGHIQVTTTNTYLAASPVTVEEELRAYEQRRGKSTESQTPKTDPAGRTFEAGTVQ
jgi:integrase